MKSYYFTSIISFVVKICITSLIIMGPSTHWISILVLNVLLILGVFLNIFDILYSQHNLASIKIRSPTFYVLHTNTKPL